MDTGAFQTPLLTVMVERRRPFRDRLRHERRTIYIILGMVMVNGVQKVTSNNVTIIAA